MTFPYDMDTMDMVDMDMVDVNMVDVDMVDMDMVVMDMVNQKFLVNFKYLGSLPRIISRTCLDSLVLFSNKSSSKACNYLPPVFLSDSY